MTTHDLAAFCHVVAEHDDHAACIHTDGITLRLPTEFAAMHYADVLTWVGDQLTLGGTPVTLVYDRPMSALTQQRKGGAS